MVLPINLKTPLRADTRFLLTVYLVTAVLVLVAVGRPPDGEVLAFLGGALAWFTGQSQWGQTRRTVAVVNAQAAAAQDVDPTTAGPQ